MEKVTSSKGKTSQTQRELEQRLLERRETVKDLRRRGIAVSAIANLLGCSPDTIWADIRGLRDEASRFEREFVSSEQIGETIDLLREIERKSMYLADVAENEEQVVYRRNKHGKLNRSLETVPNHSVIQRYFSTAIEARKQANGFLVTLGMLKANPQRFEVNGHIDISKVPADQLPNVRAEIKARIAAIEKEIHDLENSPNPFEEPFELDA